MGNVYLESQNKTSSQSVSHQRQGDCVVDVCMLIWKAALFLWVEPYKGFWYRFQHQRFLMPWIVGSLIASIPIYFIFLDEAVVRYYMLSPFLAKMLPSEVLDYRAPVFLFLILHLILLLWRIPWMRWQKKSEDLFKELGICPSSVKKDKIRAITKYYLGDDQWRMVIHNPGIDIEIYRSNKNAIGSKFNFDVTDINTAKNNKYVIHIDYRTKEFPLNIAYDEFYSTLTLKPFEFGIGKAISGQTVITSLSEMIHMLIGGTTGSGKSSFIRQVLFTLLSQETKLKIFFVDLKEGVEGSVFKNDPRVTVIRKTDRVLKIIKKLHKAYKERLNLFEQKGATNVAVFERMTKKKLTRYLLIIDECAEIFLPSTDNAAEKKNLKAIKAHISQLSRLARSAGIHLMLCTQRPSRDAINMQAKANMVTGICFRVGADYISRMVIDSTKACKIDNKHTGRAFWKGSEGIIELQTPYLDEQDARQRVQALEPDVDYLKDEAILKPDEKTAIGNLRPNEDE